MKTYLETDKPREGEQTEQERYSIDAILSHTTLSEKKPNSRDVMLAALYDQDPVHIVDYQALDPMLAPDLRATVLSEYQDTADDLASIVKTGIHLRLLAHHLQFEGLQMVFGDALSSELPRFSQLPDFIPYANWRLEQQSQTLQKQS